MCVDDLVEERLHTCVIQLLLHVLQNVPSSRPTQTKETRLSSCSTRKKNECEIDTKRLKKLDTFVDARSSIDTFP